MLLVLSGNISTTPRAKKFIETAIRQGWEIDLYMLNRGDKWFANDKLYLSSNNVTGHYLPFSRKESLYTWLIGALMKEIGEFFTFSSSLLQAMATSKANVSYILNSSKITNRGYSLVMGFSQMIYPAQALAQKFDVPFAFDMEDYHPWENMYHRNRQREITRRNRFYCSLLPKAAFVTFASPLIKHKTDELLKQSSTNIVCGKVVNNTFNSSDFEIKAVSDEKVQFVWFSQTVSYGRGLEQILPALAHFSAKVHLTIIGNMDQTFFDRVLQPYSSFVTVKGVMTEQNLHGELSNYDVGLSIEQTCRNNMLDNRILCLTNKIFAYLLAGCYILATDTPAQSEFINRDHRNHGKVCGQYSEDMILAVGSIIDNIDAIRKEKPLRFAAAKSSAWENEEKKIIDLLHKIL